jgi:single-stranded DNA-specific DHH superfamily exonuclease
MQNKGLSEIKKRLKDATKFTNVAVVYDFDIDGCTSAALLWRFFMKENVNAKYYPTTRGFQNVTMERIRKQNPDKIITVDHVPDEELTDFLANYNLSVLDHHPHIARFEKVDYVTAHDHGIGGSMGYVLFKALEKELKDVDWIVKLGLFWDKAFEGTEFYEEGIYRRDLEKYLPFNLVASFTQVRGAEKVFEVLKESSSFEEADEKIRKLDDYKNAKETFDNELKEIKFSRKSFPDIKLDIYWMKTKFKHIRVYVDYITFSKEGTNIFVLNEVTQFKFSFRTAFNIDFLKVIAEVNKEFPSFTGGGHAKACGAVLRNEQVEEVLSKFIEAYKEQFSKLGK